MTIFNLKKKNQEIKKTACSTGNANSCCNEANNHILYIKVLGSGCKNCHTLLDNTKKAVQAMNLSVEVEYITGMQKIMEYGVMSMPAIIVNEKVVSMGKVLKTNDVENLLHKIGF